jgi:hypothetical protein
LKHFLALFVRTLIFKGVKKNIHIIFYYDEMHLRSGNIINEDLEVPPFKEELSRRLQKIKQCKVKRNMIYHVLETLNYIETKIVFLLENKKHTNKIMDWLQLLEKQSYSSKCVQRFEIRSVLSLRKKTHDIKKMIFNFL